MYSRKFQVAKIIRNKFLDLFSRFAKYFFDTEMIILEN